MNAAQENALRIYIQKIENENAQMRKLSTVAGFYNEYFNELKTAKSNREAFNLVNERFHSLFGHYRYSDWDSFKKMVNYYSKK